MLRHKDQKLMICFLFVNFVLVCGNLPAQDSIPLPVRKVVLYKNGMGYFEHLGAIRDRQNVEISLPRTQLNDVLKSLTVLDLGGGKVSAVTYDSTAPFERRLGEIPIDLSATKNLVGFLNQVQGAEIEVEAPQGKVEGRLMGAELRNRLTGSGLSIQAVEASLLTTSGELLLVQVDSAKSIKFKDPAFARDLIRYLDLLSSRHSRDVRRLRIETVGSGERQLYVSYTSEAPIWKTTYRIILDPDRKPLLQGWAIVDNTTPMDWENVTLSLVAGAPVSFVMNLSQPIYARRPVVPLPEGVQVSPQLHEGTLVSGSGRTGISGTARDQMGGVLPGVNVKVLGASGETVLTSTSQNDGSFDLNLPPGSYRFQAALAGYQSADYPNIEVSSGRITVMDFSLASGIDAMEEFRVAAGPRSSAAEAKDEIAESENLPLGSRRPLQLLQLGLSSTLREKSGQFANAAVAETAGEQFEYSLLEPITIHRNESGLLPIINTEIDGEKVSVFNPDTAEKHPRLAFWLDNTSNLTLDAGSFTVIDTNAFAGEGLLESVQPSESRLLSYALDLGVEISSDFESERQRVERIEINRGVMRIHRKVVEKRSYLVRNNSEKRRTVVIEHPLRSGYELVQSATPVETTASLRRFKVDADPDTTTGLTVQEEKPEMTTYVISNITNDQIQLWLKESTIDAGVEKALREIVEKKEQVAALNSQISSLDQEERTIFRDQERLRNNLQRLGRTPEEASLRLRYIKRMEEQETRLDALRVENERLVGERDAAQRELNELIQTISIDRKI